MIPASERIFIGVLRLVLRIPGARTLKDRRQVIHSLRDRIQSGRSLSFHEIDPGEDPQLRTVVVTTSGNDARAIRSVLDRCAGLVHEHPIAEASEIDIDVFRWSPSEVGWAERMMAEVGSRGGDTDE